MVTPPHPTVTPNGNTPNPLDSWAQRLVLVGIVGCLHMSLLGCIILPLYSREIPPSLTAMAGMALGALANALVAETRHRS